MSDGMSDFIKRQIANCPPNNDFAESWLSQVIETGLKAHRMNRKTTLAKLLEDFRECAAGRDLVELLSYYRLDSRLPWWAWPLRLVSPIANWMMQVRQIDPDDPGEIQLPSLPNFFIVGGFTGVWAWFASRNRKRNVG